jgi:hypothetical protein
MLSVWDSRCPLHISGTMIYRCRETTVLAGASRKLTPPERLGDAKLKENVRLWGQAPLLAIK